MTKNKINFTIFDAQIFCALYDLGSTTEVAKKLEINPSLVSIGLNRFEKKISSGKLFTKLSKTGKYTPTKSANNIIQYMKYVVQFAEQGVKQNSYADKNVIITSTHTVLHYFLGDYIKDFIFGNPDLYIDFRQSETIDPKNFEVNEIGLTFFVDNIENRKFFPYHTFKQKLWASPEYIEKFGEPQSYEDLKNHRLLLRKDIDDPRWLFGSNYLRSQLDQNEHLHFHKIYSTSLIGKLCSEGCGIMAAAEESVKLEKGNYINVFPDFRGEEVGLYVCVDKEFLETDLAKKTVNWIFEKRNKAFEAIDIQPAYSFNFL